MFLLDGPLNVSSIRVIETRSNYDEVIIAITLSTVTKDFSMKKIKFGETTKMFR